MKDNSVGFNLMQVLTITLNEQIISIATIYCHRPKNPGFDVKNDVISGVVFHLNGIVCSVFENFLYYNRNPSFIH